jgi:hypothetical protein
MPPRRRRRARSSTSTSPKTSPSSAPTSLASLSAYERSCLKVIRQIIAEGVRWKAPNLAALRLELKRVRAERRAPR